MKQEENSSETYIKLDNVDRPFSPINKSKSIRSSISERELCFDTALTNSDPAWNTEVLRSLTSNFFEDGISTIGFSTKRNPNNDRSANNLTLIENNNNNCKESLKGTVNGRSTSSLNIQLTSQPLLLDEEFEKVNIQS
ncbi:unnamed protein product [Auanema sp. JU1783]|nr:unnamed protein product [Auanema sp. JU1783]